MDFHHEERAMKNISLAMLARQIGVGVATVDRVLNERGGVSPQTTRKVLQAAREAGLKRIPPRSTAFPGRLRSFSAAMTRSSFRSWRRILPPWRIASAIAV